MTSNFGQASLPVESSLARGLKMTVQSEEIPIHLNRHPGELRVRFAVPEPPYKATGFE